jgi:hypothetical protein
VNDDDLQISNLAEIAEVDRFGSGLEFPQPDSVQRWSSPRSYEDLRGAAREGEMWERGEAHGGDDRRAPQRIPLSIVCLSSSKESLI